MHLTVRQWLQIGVITAAAAAVYGGLRWIPTVECGFLHYEPVEVTADGIEICGKNAVPMFVDLTRLSFPVQASLTPLHSPEAGKPVTFQIELKLNGQKPLLPHELLVTHTELMHVLVVDPTLEDYHHVHPEPVGATGLWSFTITPRYAGEYTVFAEVVPLRSRRQVIASSTFSVAGVEQPVADFHQGRLSHEDEEYRYQLLLDGAPSARGRENRMTLGVSRLDGEAMQLEPVMGAYAHLVAFDETIRGFAHLHPIMQLGATENDPYHPQLNFAMSTRLPGNYRVWAQVKLEGSERFIPFDIVVQ